jgi:hypothetical protein
MGGPGANDDLDQAHRTQVWLAASDDSASQVSGKYFYHLKAEEPLAAPLDGSLQDRFIAAREQLTGIRDFSAVLYSSGAARGDRMYCLGEQPMTRRKALPKALSDS